MHTHCPINCLGPGAIQHILHPEPAQKKELNKRRFSVSSHRDCLVFLFAAVNSLLLSIGIIVLPASWRMWHVAVRRGTISEDKETYFSPKFDPRPPVSQLSKQILYSWFPAGEQPRSGTHAFIFPSACSCLNLCLFASLSVNFFPPAPRPWQPLFTLSGLFA